jgi:hypothetical protein
MHLHISHIFVYYLFKMLYLQDFLYIIWLRSQSPDYTVKTIHIDNVGEFTSQSFNDYCMLIRIIFEYFMTHVYTQNGLSKSLIYFLL